MTNELTIIAAASINNVIGNNNKLIWHIPKDLIRFKELTSNHAVIMGRKTFESLPYPLPNLSLIHISEPTRPLYISYAVFCLRDFFLMIL